MHHTSHLLNKISYHCCVLGKNLSTGQKLSVLREWDDWLREFPYVQLQQ